MAYLLSNSVLQLADSPWLRPEWTLDQVSHFEYDEGPTARLTGQPYTTADNQMIAGGQTATTTNLVRNKTSFSLGIALIELSFQKRLAELRETGDLDVSGNAHPFTDHITATRLLPLVEQRELGGYSEAVKCCLFGSFSAVGPTFENTAFQDQFYA
jgi:hypothetical protein